MPKRYYDAISDGGPGEDDARYASAHYNEAGQHYQHYQQRQAHIGSSSSYQQPSAAAAAAGTSSTSPATSGYSPTHSYTTHAHPHPLDLAPIIPAAHASSSTSDIPAVAAAPAAPVADAPSPTDRERPYTRVPYEDEETYTYVVTPEMRDEFFREVHGRQLNTMQPLYQLPADDEEIKVCVCEMLLVDAECAATDCFF